MTTAVESPARRIALASVAADVNALVLAIRCWRAGTVGGDLVQHRARLLGAAVDVALTVSGDAVR